MKIIDIFSSKKATDIIIIVMLVVVFLLFVKGGVLSGLLDNISFVSFNGENVATNTDATDSDSAPSDEGDGDSNPRYEQKHIEENLGDENTYLDYSNIKLAWWFKRDDNHGPSGCDDTIELSDYNAYYLDEDAEEKIIYLTIDCGYENGFSNQILDTLKEYDVPVCFFVTQTYIRDNPEIIKRMKEEGHQVGNHTITHPSLPGESYADIIHEVVGTADYMKETTGYEMDPYLRPPMGEYSERTLKITQDLGYKTIFWSMAYLDYDVNNQPGVEYVVNHFKKYHHSGAIVLIHNVSSSNANALETVIKNLQREGYRFASLNEL